MARLFDPYGKIGNFYIKSLQDISDNLNISNNAVLRWV
jgi:hypothetical protein